MVGGNMGGPGIGGPLGNYGYGTGTMYGMDGGGGGYGGGWGGMGGGIGGGGGQDPFMTTGLARTYYGPGGAGAADTGAGGAYYGGGQGGGGMGQPGGAYGGPFGGGGAGGPWGNYNPWGQYAPAMQGVLANRYNQQYGGGGGGGYPDRSVGDTAASGSVGMPTWTGVGQMGSRAGLFANAMMGGGGQMGGGISPYGLMGRGISPSQRTPEMMDQLGLGSTNFGGGLQMSANQSMGGMGGGQGQQQQPRQQQQQQPGGGSPV
jgi:hypothetical protein